MTKKYSIEDLTCAKVILAEKDERTVIGTRSIGGVIVYAYGDYIHHRKHVQWATKVVRWWRSFWTAVGVFRLQLNDQALALKGVWQCIKQGIAPAHIVRDWRGHRTGKAPKRWSKTPESSREPVHGWMEMRSRAPKWERRERYGRKTDRMERELNSSPHGYTIQEA